RVIRIELIRVFAISGVLVPLGFVVTGGVLRPFWANYLFMFVGAPMLVGLMGYRVLPGVLVSAFWVANLALAGWLISDIVSGWYVAVLGALGFAVGGFYTGLLIALRGALQREEQQGAEIR